MEINRYLTNLEFHLLMLFKKDTQRGRNTSYSASELCFDDADSGFLSSVKLFKQLGIIQDLTITFPNLIDPEFPFFKNPIRKKVLANNIFTYQDIDDISLWMEKSTDGFLLKNREVLTFNFKISLGDLNKHLKEYIRSYKNQKISSPILELLPPNTQQDLFINLINGINPMMGDKQITMTLYSLSNILEPHQSIMELIRFFETLIILEDLGVIKINSFTKESCCFDINRIKLNDFTKEDKGLLLARIERLIPQYFPKLNEKLRSMAKTEDDSSSLINYQLRLDKKKRTLFVNNLKIKQFKRLADPFDALKFIIQKPNEKIWKHELEVELNKDIRKLSVIIDGLGIKGKSREAFFDIEADYIILHNPVTQLQLNNLGVSDLDVSDFRVQKKTPKNDIE